MMLCQKYSTFASMENYPVLYNRQDSGYPGSPVILEAHHIRRNYKFLKREMEPNIIVDHLVERNILNTDENSYLIRKPRAIKCDFILRKLLQHPKHLLEFTTMINFNPKEQGFHCFLSLPRSASENPNAIEKVAQSTNLGLGRALEKNRDELLGEIRSRISSESDSIVDDFLEEDVLPVDDHEEISTEINKSKAAVLLLNCIKKRLPKSYLALLSVLRTYEVNDLCDRLEELDDDNSERTESKEPLTVKFLGGDMHLTLTAPKKEMKRVEVKIINADGSIEIFTAVMNEISNSEETFAQGTHSTIDKISLGSITIVLQTESCYAMAKLKHFIEKEDISKFMAQLFESSDVRKLLTKEKYNIEIQIREAQEPTDPSFDTLQSTERQKPERTYKSCLERCHSFLLEEIEPRSLLKEKEVADIFGSDLEKMNQPGLRTARVEAFLEYLKNQPEEKIKVVVEKLKEKYRYIYGQLFPNTAKYQNIDIEQVKGNILDNLPELLDVVSIRAVQTPLLSTGIISSEELDFLHKSSGSLRKEILQFVKLVLHRGAEAIKIFLSALETSYGESTVENLLQQRDIQMTSADEGRHAKIDYKAFNEEDGLLFKGIFLLELKTEAQGEKQDEKCIYAEGEGPPKDGSLETLSDSSSDSDSSNATQQKPTSDSESKVTSTKDSRVETLEFDSSEVLSDLTRKLGNVEDVLAVKCILSSTNFEDKKQRDEVQRRFPKKYDKIKEDVLKLQQILKELQGLRSVFTEKHEYFLTEENEEWKQRLEDEAKETSWSRSTSHTERQDTIGTSTDEYGDTSLTESDEDKLESSDVLNQQSSKYQGILMCKLRHIEKVRSVMAVFRNRAEKETQLMAIKKILNEEQYKKLEKYIIKLQGISEKIEKAFKSPDVA